MPRAVDPQSPRVEKRYTPCPPNGWISSPLIAQSTHSTAVSLSGSGSLPSPCSLGAESVVVRCMKHQHPAASVGGCVTWLDFWSFFNVVTPHTHDPLTFGEQNLNKNMIYNFSTFNHCLLHTSYNMIEPFYNISRHLGGMLWSIYGTVNSAESGEFTGAVKYPLLLCTPVVLGVQ